VTRPENADQAEVQVASDELGAAADEPAQDPAQKSPSGNATAAPPQQRQRAAEGDGDPKTVKLQVGAPEHARGAVREQADRQPLVGRAYGFSPGVGPPLVADGATRRKPSGSGGGPGGPSVGNQSVGHGTAPDFSPSAVRVGGYTPPERVPPAVAGTTPRGSGRSVRVPRRTSLQLQRLDPWSVLKLSLVLSVAGFLVWLVAVGVLYGVLAGMGVWDQINGTYSDLTSANNAQMSTELVSGGRVFGVAMVIGLVNIVLMTALATVGSLVYNVAADLVGGIEITLSEPD
jgi:Transmembrane domain of unknown function (DUF3566)